MFVLMSLTTRTLALVFNADLKLSNTQLHHSLNCFRLTTTSSVASASCGAVVVRFTSVALRLTRTLLRRRVTAMARNGSRGVMATRRPRVPVRRERLAASALHVYRPSSFSLAVVVALTRCSGYWPWTSGRWSVAGKKRRKNANDLNARRLQSRVTTHPATNQQRRIERVRVESLQGKRCRRPSGEPSRATCFGPGGLRRVQHSVDEKGNKLLNSDMILASYHTAPCPSIEKRI